MKFKSNLCTTNHHYLLNLILPGFNVNTFLTGLLWWVVTEACDGVTLKLFAEIFMGAAGAPLPLLCEGCNIYLNDSELGFMVCETWAVALGRGAGPTADANLLYLVCKLLVLTSLLLEAGLGAFLLINPLKFYIKTISTKRIFGLLLSGHHPGGNRWSMFVYHLATTWQVSARLSFLSSVSRC